MAPNVALTSAANSFLITTKGQDELSSSSPRLHATPAARHGATKTRSNFGLAYAARRYITSELLFKFCNKLFN